MTDFSETRMFSTRSAGAGVLRSASGNSQERGVFLRQGFDLKRRIIHDVVHRRHAVRPEDGLDLRHISPKLLDDLQGTCVSIGFVRSPVSCFSVAGLRRVLLTRSKDADGIQCLDSRA